MKIITISKIGYNAPSSANWAWGIWKVDFIDTDSQYCMAYTTKENFGGDSRFRAEILAQTGHTVIETKGVYTDTCTQKITGVAKLHNLEGKDFIKICTDFINESTQQ